MNYKIAYLISHGHTARGAFQTELLLKLYKAGIEVVVIAKKGAEEVLKKNVNDQKAQLDFYQPNIGVWDIQLSIFRSFVHQNINNNPALLEKHQRRTRGKKISFKRKTSNVLYYYIGNFIRVIPPLKRIYSKLEKRLFRNEDAVKLLSKYNFDAIISTRPVDTMEIELLNAASKLGIHKIMYILSWDNITSKGVFPELADSYLTWGEIMNDELKEYYDVKDAQLYTTGVTHFDVHAQVRNNPPKINNPVSKLGLTPEKPYLFFTMSASYYAPNEIDIIEYLAGCIEQNKFGEEMQLIVRPHMINLMKDKSDINWTKRLESIQSKRVAVDFPQADNSLLTWYMKKDDMIKLSTLINGASLCLNSGSTVAIEAITFNKPVIITLFDTEEWPEWLSVQRIKEYIHLKKLFGYNAVDVVYSLQELDDAILINLNDKNKKEKERKAVLLSECYKVDGCATDRFVSNVSSILSKVS